MPTNNQSGAVSDDGLAEFTEYFVRNYPGPDTIIGNPNWHAPKIFRAALRALRKTELDAGGGMSVPFNHRAASADARATTPPAVEGDPLPGVEVPCNMHPDAPHGFDRNASHSEDRYVCDCEGWEPEAALTASRKVSHE